MKNLFTLIVVVAVGYFAYNYFMNPLSEEESRIKAFETQYREAVQLSKQAGSAAALGGVDTTSTYEEGAEKVKRLRVKLEDLLENLKEDKAIERAEKLLDKMDLFLKDYE